MTANKHTPGPWHVGFADDSGPGYITTFDSGLVVVRGGYANGLKFGAIRKSDARLIAAAPKLLEALTKKVQDAEQRMFEDWLEFNSPSGDHEDVQRQWLESNDYRAFIGEWREQLDAIAKATGGAA